jgi:hypothetical protein
MVSSDKLPLKYMKLGVRGALYLAHPGRGLGIIIEVRQLLKPRRSVRDKIVI